MTEGRDPKLSRRYREFGAEEPSRELDQAILAAAHRSVDKPHAPLVVPAGRHRWYYSLAAAAVLVLAIAVTLHVDRQRPDAEAEVPPPPAAAPAPQPQKVEPPVQEKKQGPRAYAPDPPAAPAAAPAPAPLPQAQPESKTKRPAGAMADSANEARRDEASAAREVPAPAAARSRAAPLPGSSAPMAAQYAASDPHAELERIAELRRQGKDDEADKALAEFRKRFPGYAIPEDMRAKVERR